MSLASFTDKELIGRLQQAREQKEEALKKGRRSDRYLADMCTNAIQKMEEEAKLRGLVTMFD